MQSLPRLAAAAAVLLMISLGASMLAVGAADPGLDSTPFGFDDDFWYSRASGWSTGNLDSSIDEAASSLKEGEEMEVVIQFHPPLEDTDIEAAEEAGFRVLHRLTALPAIFATGGRSAVERIARYPDVFWIENNTVMEFQMDKTTTTINASKTWDSIIVDSASKEYPGIDGEGVTVVVLDSGIDAGHPDLDLGEKTVKNYKSDSDFVWREVENGDTSSGHGTHCAGTVAGNGDASSGGRRGVAPGAKLIGLSTGEAVSIFNAIGGLNWVYEHSRPGHTYEWEDPIRAVSNSWGPGPGDYNPEDSVSIISQKITFENNVIVVFAASNSGGDGTDIQTNPYGNVPSNLCIAAFERDGSGIASFSSRGQMGIETTYPDFGAPGVGIWSTAARRTLISLMTKQSAGGLANIDPYYFAISGTSMATPHVAGVVALLFQAYPGLKMSEMFAKADKAKLEAGWENDTRNRVHEVELILQATAKYVLPSDGGSPLAENNIPQNYSIGWNGKPFDFAQGFGIVQVDRAVALALTLKELRERDFDGDGSADYPNATVAQALSKYDAVLVKRERSIERDQMYTAWNGEWSRFSNQTSQVIPMQHDISKMVYIPETAGSLEVRFTFDPWNSDEKRVASLYVTIDQDGDGSVDWRQQGSPLSDARTDVIDLSGAPTGTFWSFNVEGRGVDWNLGERWRETQYREVKVEYTVSLNLTFGEGEHVLPEQDQHAKVAFWKPLGSEPTPGTSINVTEYTFDLRKVTPLEAPPQPEEKGMNLTWLLLLLALIAAAGAGYYLWKRSKKAKQTG